MGLFSFVGGLLGGSSKKKAAGKAAAAQIEFAQKGLDETKRQFDISRADQLPWLETGKEALGEQADLLGLNGIDTQEASIASLKDSPLFKALFGAGEEAIMANASATGGLRGGNVQRSLADFGSDTLSQVIERQLANLGGISSQGGATGAGLGALGADAASAMAKLFGQQGSAKAGKYLAKGAINAQNWSNAGSFIDDAITSFLPGGGGIKGLF